MRASAFLFALAACAGASLAQAAELGTLFYTPSEREHLDRLRRGESVEATVQAGPLEHSLTGYVQRSDGRGTAWIDGRPIQVRDPKAARIFDPGSVRAYSRSADEVKMERSPPR